MLLCYGSVLVKLWTDVSRLCRTPAYLIGPSEGGSDLRPFELGDSSPSSYSPITRVITLLSNGCKKNSVLLQLIAVALE